MWDTIGCVWEESAFFTGCSALTLALDFLPKSQLWVGRRLPEKGRVCKTCFPVSSGNLAQQRMTRNEGGRERERDRQTDR